MRIQYMQPSWLHADGGHGIEGRGMGGFLQTLMRTTIVLHLEANGQAGESLVMAAPLAR
ncbi:hypothetical protein [Thauera sp.]|uniref:hypothetical protein n=1 Tax=Thauera sp. TaxID=1905334 RepID=UPI0039E48638